MSLQSTVSESTLVALLAARKNKILEMKVSEPDTDESSLNSRLIAYASDQVGSYDYRENKLLLLSQPMPCEVAFLYKEKNTGMPYKHEPDPLLLLSANGETKSV